jgi:hypothetical protein
MAEGISLSYKEGKVIRMTIVRDKTSSASDDDEFHDGSDTHSIPHSLSRLTHTKDMDITDLLSFIDSARVTYSKDLVLKVFSMSHKTNIPGLASHCGRMSQSISLVPPLEERRFHATPRCVLMFLIQQQQQRQQYPF